MKKIAVFNLLLCLLFILSGCNPAINNNNDDNAVSYGTKESISLVSKRDEVQLTGVSDKSYTQQTSATTSFIHNISGFKIGKYEVTYHLWFTVYQWAIKNGYTFANAGMEGKDGYPGYDPSDEGKETPVTTVSFRDVIVWCNAYSQMLDLTPCYTYDGSVVKVSNNKEINYKSCDAVICDWEANGYRLPTEGEWQYAASCKGEFGYNYASGSSSDCSNDTSAWSYGWYNKNATEPHKVGTKEPNSWGLYDMSGNVREWCYDIYGGELSITDDQSDFRGVTAATPLPESGIERVIRGGAWADIINDLAVGHRDKYYPYSGDSFVGFRVVRKG